MGDGAGTTTRVAVGSGSADTLKLASTVANLSSTIESKDLSFVVTGSARPASIVENTPALIVVIRLSIGKGEAVGRLWSAPTVASNSASFGVCVVQPMNMINRTRQ